MPDPLRDEVLRLLRGGHAHATFDDAVGGLPPDARGARAPNCPHTPWRIVEHLRIAQWDILDYCRNPDYEQPNWPDDYWPEGDAPPSPAAWDESVAKFRGDLEAMQSLVADPSLDLLAPIPHIEDGPSLLREALLLADHNAYHIGQLIVLRRVLGFGGELGS